MRVWGTGVLACSKGNIGARGPRLPGAAARTAATNSSDFISHDPIGGTRPEGPSLSYNPPRHLTPEAAAGSPCRSVGLATDRPFVVVCAIGRYATIPHLARSLVTPAEALS